MFRASLIILALSASLRAEAPYSGPKALGPYLVDDIKFPLQRLFDVLGPPASAKSETFCYESSDGKAAVSIERMAASAGSLNAAGSVLISEFRNCIGQPRKMTLIDPKAWRTEKEVGLGSTTEELMKAHGKPSVIDPIVAQDYRWVIAGDNPRTARPELGKTVWVYGRVGNDLRIAEFGIRNGKVVWIFLSHNE